MFKPPTPDRQSWLVEAVRFYRQMEFFREQENLSDEQLATHLDAEYARRFGRPFPHTGERSDIGLVSFDTSRIWWKDGEGDINPGDDVYVSTLQEWGNISRGSFLPTDIQEVWDHPKARPPTGPMRIHFTLNGQRHFLEPEPGYGWIDFMLLEDINRLIKQTGRAFEEYEPVDDATCLIVLTAAEKSKLRRERKWRFA